MKKILSIALLASMSLPVLANDLIYTTFAPTYSTQALTQCNNGHPESCVLMTVYVPFSSTTMMLLSAALKEEIQQVEPDAYAYLAGEEMSLALASLLEEARSRSEELAPLSDKELSAVLIQSLSL